MSTFHKLRVAKVLHMTNESVKLTFDIPKELKSNFKFIPGQYIILRAFIKGEEVRRAYSICTAPMEDNFGVAVKKIPNGVFSSFLKDEVKEGDFLDVSEPDGRFVFMADIWKNENIGFFAAGSGITPVMSIIKSVLSETNLKMILAYGNKTIKDALFFNELRALEKNFPDRLKVLYAFSREEIPNTHHGRINEELIKKILNFYSNWNLQRFYLCGPDKMISMITDTLIASGINKVNILRELFFVVDVPKHDFSGTRKVHIITNNVDTTIEADASKSLLQMALDNNIEVSYSCKSGVCCSCIARITDGRVAMVHNEILDEKEVRLGKVLSCQSHALTDEVTIDFRK